jgi:hypothetical protein
MPLKTKLICGKKPNASNKGDGKIIHDAYNACITYMKCSNAKCNNADMKLKEEVEKLPFQKPVDIMQKCMHEKDIKQCTLNKYSKLSSTLKAITSDIQNCKDNLCKTEHTDMTTKAMKTVKSMEKYIKKMFKNIKKNKTLMKTTPSKLKKQLLTKKHK